MQMNKLRAALALLLLAELVMPSFAQSTPQSVLTSELCGIIAGVQQVVGVLALAMFLVGGILYAAAHFMPSAGQTKSQMQGWSMGMIIGGIIGVILVIAAPPIVSLVIGFGGTSIATPVCN